MSLPSLAKSYQFAINQAITTSGTLLTDMQTLWYGIYSMLTGFSSSPWVSSMSSNSVAVNSSGNNWSGGASLAWNSSGVHSWNVLKQPGLSNAQLCIDMNVSTSYSIGLYYSPGGLYTGGSTSARPTATDEMAVLVNGSIATSTPTNVKYHGSQSTDGTITRVIVCQNSSVYGYFSIEVPTNTPAAWTNPVVCTGISASNNLTWGQLSGVSNSKVRIGSTTYSVVYSGEGYGSSYLPVAQTYPNDLDSNYPFYPIGLVSTTAGSRGRLGTLQDIWWGVPTNPVGSSYPASGTTYQFAQFNNIIIPWDSVHQPAIQ